MATPITSSLPEEQPQDQAVPSSQLSAANNGGWHSSSAGSIGPFFAVISVLTLLAFLSCVVGRIYSRRVADHQSPLESIRGGAGCFGWLKGRFTGGDAVILGSGRDDAGKVQEITSV